MEDHLNGFYNPYLERYKFKRKLDNNYFRLIDQKFPSRDVCYFCLTAKNQNASIECKKFCKQQLELRTGHKLIRDTVLARDNYTCQLCGVQEHNLSQALKILKKANNKLWKSKRAELHIPEKRVGCLLDVDHILPISKGGGCGIEGNILLNLRSVCIYCHFNVHTLNNGSNPKPAKAKAKNRKIL